MGNKEELIEQRTNAVREIIWAEALAGEWLPIPEEFYNGTEIGFDVAGVSVRALVAFDSNELMVLMTSPVKTMGGREIYFRRQTFFRRNPPGASLFVGGVEGGPASPKCINAAKEILIGLYSDWVILHSRKDVIREKVSGFPDFEADYLESEKARIAPIKKRIRSLSLESGDIKRRFKAGELTQEEYINLRRPVHDTIVFMMELAKVKDPFQIRFSEELSDCRYVMDKRGLIESI